MPSGKAPSAAAVLRAHEAAERATLPKDKARLVVALGGLSAHFIFLRCRYARLMDTLAHVRKGWYAIKCDALSGYYQLPLSPSEQPYCGIAIVTDAEGTVEHFLFTRLPMGLGPSAFIFSLFSGLVHEIFVRRWASSAAARAGALTVSFAYIDDIVIFCSTKEAAMEARELLLATMRECGMTPNLAKTSPAPVGHDSPSPQDVYLGLRLNLATLTLHLPAEKQIRTLAGALVLQRCAAAGLPVPELSLARLGGRVVWWSNVDPLLSSHTRELCTWTNWSRWGKASEWRRAIHTFGATSASQLNALLWFTARAEQGLLKGCTLLSPGRPCLVATSDASGSANAVAILSEATLTRFVLPDCHILAIPVLEELAAPLFLHRHGEALRGCTLIWGFDALGAAYWLARGKARRDDGNDLVRLVRLACEHYDIVLIVKWLTRWWNFTADHGADFPLHSLPAMGVPVPSVCLELTLQGLPPAFLGAWARKLDPSFLFSRKWEEVNDRGTH